MRNFSHIISLYENLLTELLPFLDEERQQAIKNVLTEVCVSYIIKHRPSYEEELVITGAHDQDRRIATRLSIQ